MRGGPEYVTGSVIDVGPVSFMCIGVRESFTLRVAGLVWEQFLYIDLQIKAVHSERERLVESDEFSDACQCV